MALHLYGSQPMSRPCQFFGMGPEDLLPYNRPWNTVRHFDWPTLGALECIPKKSHIGEDGFHVSLDVGHFQPNEISVKTENNSVVIDAKHEDIKDDHGFISREFRRRYELPDGFKAEDVTSTLSSDGVLTIKAPPSKATEGNVRHVQIHHIGPVHLHIPEQKEEKKSVGSDDQKNGK